MASFRNRGGIMLKIKLDKKIISNIVNVYFILLLWVCLIGISFQSSNEFVFVSFLIFSLFYFIVQILKFFLEFKLLSLKEKKMSKKIKTALEKKYKANYLIVKRIVHYYTIFIFGLSFIYTFLFIESISPILLLIMVIILVLWIIYLLFYNIKA